MRQRSATDPADFWTLIGRFTAAQVLNVLMVGAVLSRQWFSAVLFGIASLFVHRAMVGLYRRLRSERATELEAQGRVGEP
ncbi:MAG: hypothetical protein ACKO5K_03550 [Armatimonadota bacterium]